MSDPDSSGRDPYEDRLSRARERMSTDYDDASPPPRARARGARTAGDGRLDRLGGLMGGLLGSDPTTRRLAYGAAGLGGLLVLGIGGWALLGHAPSGIPVLGPPPGPVRVRPVDPGGMQVLGADAPVGDDGGVARLAPGPEQPRPDQLAQRYGQPPAADGSAGAGGAAVAPASPESAPLSPAPVPASPTAPAAAPVAMPAAPPTDTSSVAPGPASVPAPESAPLPAPEAPPDGRYGVQLAALDSQEAAQREWARLVQHYPDLFAGHTPVIERTERNGAVFFRLRTRGFASVAKATSFCEHARLNGLACTLAGF
jgi:SPOR domain